MKVVNGDVRVNDFNPPEMARSAEKIAHWINEKRPEQSQHLVPMKLKDNPGYPLALRLKHRGRLQVQIKEQDLHQLILSVGMAFEINHANASIVAVSSKRTHWNATCAPLLKHPNSIQCALSIANLKLYVFRYTGATDFIREMSDNGRKLTVTALQTASVRVNANGQLRMKDHHLRAFNSPSYNDEELISRFMKWLNKVIEEKSA
ncbi:unnamed protein product [Hymenolepis diminuta]|uniref:Uncharacterized protein n=1 Tax=Hymenolepis diminuta TaxID=6216 RepID=A0A3P7A4R5_HYMDI|nr:unnamed protein product [Hymenolepis diminuta]